VPNKKLQPAIVLLAALGRLQLNFSRSTDEGPWMMSVVVC
jgi:hypothetical protein